MDYTLALILTFSIVLPALIGCIKIIKVDIAYLPIIILAIAGLVNECIGQYLIRTTGSNIFLYNLFVVLETNLLLLQFCLWDRSLKRMLVPLMLTFTSAWLLINTGVIISGDEFNSYYKIIFSLLVVLLSINLLNRRMVISRMNLLKNAASIICFGLIILYTYSTIIEVFWVYDLMLDQKFGLHVYNVLYIINCLVNLILAFAFLWIPSKPKFILQSSSPASS